MMDIQDDFYKFAFIIILIDLMLIVLSYSVVGSQGAVIGNNYTVSVVNQTTGNLNSISDGFSRMFNCVATFNFAGTPVSQACSLTQQVQNILTQGSSIIWNAFLLVTSTIFFVIVTMTAVFTLVNSLNIGFLAIILNTIIGILYVCGTFFTVYMFFKFIGSLKGN